MKKVLLVLTLSLLLGSCSFNEISSSSQDGSSILTSEKESSSEITYSSEDNVSSESVSSSSSEEKEETIIETLDYSYHPLSEPSINKQLVTFNPMGDMSTVWDYYRGDNVKVHNSK